MDVRAAPLRDPAAGIGTGGAGMDRVAAGTDGMACDQDQGRDLAGCVLRGKSMQYHVQDHTLPCVGPLCKPW